MHRALPLLLLTAGCHAPPAPGSDPGGQSIDTEDVGGPGDSGSKDQGGATITGIVDVQLYTLGSTGDVTELAWDEYSASFPFGAIFVAAYTVDDETNAYTWYDEYVISHPSIDGDPYELTVDVDDVDEVHVYAVLDQAADGVIGSFEPVGIYPDTVPLEGDTTVSDVDITIETPVSLGGSGGTDTGGAGTDVVVLSGDAELTQPYTGGNLKIMLFDGSGYGPYYTTNLTPVVDADGAAGPYELEVAAGFGEGRLMGAWDADGNGLIEPTDPWGAYVVGGESANPITVGTEDQSGLDVTIPFGTPPALTPFVRIEGDLTYAEDFSTLPAGTVVYIAAVRTRPTSEFSVADLERGYDWASFTGADLAGTNIPYLLVAPSNAIAYLWAYADHDADGVLNEAGELVGSFGRSGRLETGATNRTGVDMPLQSVVE